VRPRPRTVCDEIEAGGIRLVLVAMQDGRLWMRQVPEEQLGLEPYFESPSDLELVVLAS